MASVPLVMEALNAGSALPAIFEAFAAVMVIARFAMENVTFVVPVQRPMPVIAAEAVSVPALTLSAYTTV